MMFLAGGRPMSQDIPPDVANISLMGVPPSASVPAITAFDGSDKPRRSPRPSLASLDQSIPGI